ncbi:E3 ubiquitin-protein ligase TRIM71-like [Mytilus edulis]|uniref:E3 ubiquitin-protein ligase TRIM71-like n=1 Tax=Mytilus edulis TaxID=6550 RepID=UPI0039EE303F
MASNKPVPCGPCHKQKVNNKAVIWCYTCDEGLCSKCLNHHKRSKGTHTHQTIDIKKHNRSIQAIKTECDKHQQQLKLYCPSHLIPCCDKCVSTSHSKCIEIQSLSSVVGTTNIEKSKEAAETDISSILLFFDKLVNTKSTNIKTGEQTYLGIKKYIKEIRKEINKHLDHLENKLCQETDTIWNQEKLKATHFISEIEGKWKNLKEMKNNLHSITEHNTSKLQSFLCVHRIEQQVHQFQMYADNLQKDKRTKEFDIRMKQNGEIEIILSKLESITSLGEVMVVKTEIDLNRETSVKRKAQVKSIEHSNIHNLTMNIETKIKTNVGKWISGIMCLIDERVIVVKDAGKVILLTADGKNEKLLPIPDGSRSVTQINQNTIALSSPVDKTIKIFNMEKEKLTKVIKLDKVCHGLSFFNGTLAVGMIGHEGGEIHIIDLDGKTLKSMQVQCESDFFNVVYHNERITYSDASGKTITCIDESGKQIWQYKQDLFRPAGLCADAYGNIIVADVESDRIIVISKDGQNSKILIRKEDGLKTPTCIYLKHNESSGYICDILGTYLAKFNFSYD